MSTIINVLILVVVDNGLVRRIQNNQSLNRSSLNPCCSGQWSSTRKNQEKKDKKHVVLILVVVDNGLVQFNFNQSALDLVSCLNPCCSGQWSSTTTRHLI